MRPVLHEATGDGGQDVLSLPSPRTAVRTESDIVSRANGVLPRTSVSTKEDILSGADRVPPRTAVIHFGCRLNQFESDGIKANLEDNKHTLTQNLLQHSAEVGSLAGIMASELGEDVKRARRAGLLHDIGKGIEHTIEGSHAIVGADFAKKHGEIDAVVHAIRAHHNEEKRCV